MEKSTYDFILYVLGWYSTSYARVESTGILSNFSKFCTFVMKLLVTSLVMCWLLFWNFWTIISICFFLKESFKDKIESMILFLRYYWNMPPPSSLKLCNKPPMVGKIYSYTYSLCAHACVVCNHRFCSSIQGEKKLIRDDLCILWN